MLLTQNLSPCLACFNPFAQKQSLPLIDPSLTFFVFTLIDFDCDLADSRHDVGKIRCCEDTILGGW